MGKTIYNNESLVNPNTYLCPPKIGWYYSTRQGMDLVGRITYCFFYMGHSKLQISKKQIIWQMIGMFKELPRRKDMTDADYEAVVNKTFFLNK